jgi:hypothetical protein
MTNRDITILLLSLFGFTPFIFGQSNGSNGPNLTVKKITILKDTGNGAKQVVIDKYAQDLVQWANGKTLNMPEIPTDLKNVNVSVEKVQVNDTINTIIKIINLDNLSTDNTRVYKRNSANPEKSEEERVESNDRMYPPRMRPPNRPNNEFGGPPPPQNPDRRYNNKRKNRKSNAIVSQSRFSLGFLNVLGNDNPSQTVMDYNRMPELDAGKTLQIGFDHSWGINLIKGKIRAWIGVAYDIQNYRFENNQIRLVNRGNQFEYYFDNSGQNPGRIADKSKLVTNYLGIPISLGFQNKKRNPTLSMKVGIQAGTLVRSHSKVRYLNGDKEKYFTDFGLNNFVVSPFAVLQFKHLGIYAKYGMTDVFKRNPNATGRPNHNLSIGFTLTTNIK